LRPLAGIILALSPLLALRDALALYRQTGSARAAWHLLPGVVWGKLAWYWGIVEALLVADVSFGKQDQA
jgi:hypothetical protein